jgi:hypothetical protein
MSFTLNFDSKNNTEKLDMHILEELEKLSNCNINTKLNKIIFDHYFNQLIPKLPYFIKHIVLNYNFLNDLSNIGQHIEILEFNVNNFTYDLSLFPKYLKKLVIKADTVSMNIIQHLPDTLETLDIQCSTFNSDLLLANTNLKTLIISSNDFTKPLNNLPISLTKLKLFSKSFNHELNNLPSNLEELIIQCNLFNQELNNLPPNLKIFLLEDANSFQKPLNNLPITLERFELHFGFTVIQKYIHSLNNLSCNIKYLRLANYWGDLNIIPDSIEYLDIWFAPNKSREVRENMQNWIKLPKNMKKLDINKEMFKINKVHDFTDIIKANNKCIGIIINDVVVC